MNNTNNTRIRVFFSTHEVKQKLCLSIKLLLSNYYLGLGDNPARFTCQHRLGLRPTSYRLMLVYFSLITLLFLALSCQLGLKYALHARHASRACPA